MAERILDLTLEIIYLLTGESFPPVKSDDHVTITVLPCRSLKLKRPNMEKILEVTQRIIDLLTGEGHLEGDVMANQESCPSWDPPEELLPDEESPYCKEESLEEGNPTHPDFPPPMDLTQNGSLGIKEEPDSCQGELIISHVMECPVLSEEGSVHHTMARDLPHIDVFPHPLVTQVKEELFISDEETDDVSTRGPPDLVPLEASLEEEFTDGEVVCFKWNVVGHQGVEKVNVQRPTLRKPNDNMTKGKQFSCAECGKCCRSNTDLIQHRRIHSGEKPFQCSECGKRFSQQSTLTMHHRIHTGQKPYTCSECGKSFTSRSDLTKHSRSHTGLKPYSCPECGKFFSSSSHFFRHKKMHIGDKQFVCPECGKGFLTRSEMVIHQRIHTGERPYPCLECGKSFISSSDLVKHQRSHTGLKPHVCTECSKSYVSRSVLTRHQKIHMVEKRFFCAECGMGFIRTGKFLAHVKSHCRPRTSSPPSS